MEWMVSPNGIAVIFFASALWLAFCGFLAMATGWRTISRVFACSRVPRGRRYYLASVGIGRSEFRFLYPMLCTVTVTRDAFFIEPLFFLPFHRRLRVGVRSVVQCEHIWFGYSFKLVELPAQIRLYGAAARRVRRQLHIRNNIPPEDVASSLDMG